MGGGGQRDAVIAVVEGLAAVEENLDVTVVCGDVPPAEVEAALARRSLRHRLRFIAHGPMAGLMARADLAVTGAGSTCWELCAMGVPFVTVVLADNQALIGAGLAAARVSVDLGRHEQLTPQRIAEVVGRLAGDRDERAAMSARGKSLVDGHGAERVLGVLRPVAGGGG
jgi:spore coat polysaccharide biosynthesis predicted glycosyltransferase SpsG